MTPAKPSSTAKMRSQRGLSLRNSQAPMVTKIGAAKAIAVTSASGAGRESSEESDQRQQLQSCSQCMEKPVVRAQDRRSRRDPGKDGKKTEERTEKADDERMNVGGQQANDHGVNGIDQGPPSPYSRRRAGLRVLLQQQVFSMPYAAFSVPSILSIRYSENAHDHSDQTPPGRSGIWICRRQSTNLLRPFDQPVLGHDRTKAAVCREVLRPHPTQSRCLSPA